MARQSDLEVVIKKKSKGNPYARGASQRLSTLQCAMLAWLYAGHQRTHGSTSASHQALLQALAKDRQNKAHFIAGPSGPQP